MTAKGTFLILLIILAGLGCQRDMIPPQVEAPYPLLAPEAVLGSLRSRAHSLHSLKALAKVKVSSPKEKVGFSQVVVARKPASLRLEALSPFGQTVHLFVTNGRSLAAYYPGEGKVYVGRASQENVERLLPLGLRLAELMTVLFAEPALLDGVRSSLEWAEADRLYVVSSAAPGGRSKEVLWVEPERFILMRREIYDKDTVLVLKATMGDFEDVDGRQFPMRIDLELPRQEIHLSIRYQEVTLNPDTDVQSFSLPPSLKGEVVILDR